LGTGRRQNDLTGSGVEAVADQWEAISVLTALLRTK
jgi:hypothetical protein